MAFYGPRSWRWPTAAEWSRRAGAQRAAGLEGLDQRNRRLIRGRINPQDLSQVRVESPGFLRYEGTAPALPNTLLSFVDVESGRDDRPVRPQRRGQEQFVESHPALLDVTDGRS